MPKKHIDQTQVRSLRIKVDREIKGLQEIFETAMKLIENSCVNRKTKKTISLLKREAGSCVDRSESYLNAIEEEVE